MPRPRSEIEKAGHRAYKQRPEIKAREAERERRRYYTKRGLPVPDKYVPKPKVVEPVVPLIDAPTGHQVYEEARECLRGWERSELGSGMDSTARDLLQEFALATLEQRDPVEAVEAFRRAAYRDRMILVHGLALVDGLDR